VLACIPAAPAPAQDTTRTPSAQELWESYPLEHEASRPSPQPTARAASTATPRTGVVREGGMSTSTVIMAMLAAALLGGACVAWAERRQRPVRAGGTAQAPEAEPEAAPPDRAVAWTAEIDWRAADGAGRFRVIARSADGRTAVVGQSGPLAWPPGDPDAVQALTTAADRLEGALVGAGWTALAPGTAWYARRFGWAPDAAADPPPRSAGRFRPAHVWSNGTEERWRCEITWHAGYITSHFEATVYAPGQRRGNPIGESDRFMARRIDDSSPPETAQLREVGRMAAALRAAGWQRLGRGTEWYAERYVWPGDGTPPERLEPASVTKGGTT
jgi:hypothetical protein